MDTASKQQYDSYLKEIRISQDMIDTAIKKGKLEGIIEGKIEVVLNSYSRGIDISIICDITKLSESDVHKILKEYIEK